MKPLLVIAILCGIVGVFALTQATLGVGLLALACLFGIFARIAQADTRPPNGQS